MSSGGQLAGGALGAVAGFLIGGGPTGALYGAQIGLAVGGYLDPPKGPKQQGPNLGDLTLQTATYGAFIPRGYGTFPVTGNIFWLENGRYAVTTVETSSGKGGGSKASQESLYYTATFAVGLLDCTDGTPIAGIRRIWISNQPFSDAGSSELSAISATANAEQFFTLYKGTMDQLPDERMESTLGVGFTPAFRGLAYIVFKDFPLAQYGNSLAGVQIRVEVVKIGDATAKIIPLTSAIPIRSNNYGELAYLKGRLLLVGGSDGITAQRSLILHGASDLQNFISLPTDWPGGFGNSTIAFNGALFSISGVTYLGAGTNRVLRSDNGLHWYVVNEDAGFTPGLGREDAGVVVHRGAIYYIGGFTAGTGGRNNDVWKSEDGASWVRILEHAPFSGRAKFKPWSYKGKIWIVSGEVASATYADCWNSEDGITWTQVSANCGFGRVDDYGAVVFKDRMWMLGGFSGAWGTVTRSSDDGITWVVETISPTYPPSRNYALVADGVLFVHPDTNANVYHYEDPIGPEPVTLGSIVNAECLKSNLLTSGDINTSLLTQDVRGYRVASVTSIRSVLEPLQGAWPFDVVQSNYQITFKPRGGASVATIPASDLDAREVGAEPGVSITNSREMDLVLPRRVTLDYLDIWRAYDTGQQYAERLNTPAVNVHAINMPVALNASEAAGIVETLLYLYWLERYDIALTLPPTYNHLEPGDIITVNATEATYELRVTALTYDSDGVISVSAKYNAASVYVPVAVGAEGSAPTQGLPRLVESESVMLDIPLLADSSNQPGYPLAMSGVRSGWRGGILYRSDDAGETWTGVESVPPPGAMMGLALNAIASAANAQMIDKHSRLSVLFSSSAPSSITELALLNGANLFAYGATGRWEIIAAQTCTLQGDGTYVLSDLLRGRAGSEWAMTTHVAGDRVIALDASLPFVSTNTNSIGLARDYRTVTVGEVLDSAISETRTYTAVNLECLSPVYLNGNRHPSTNDWTLTWIRRTRIGGAWRDYVDASLGEVAELYDVEIYSSGAYTTLKRTLTGLTSPTTAYTSAQQVTDFGINQATLYVKVYQISDTVGRGYPLTTSITR